MPENCSIEYLYPSAEGNLTALEYTTEHGVTKSAPAVWCLQMAAPDLSGLRACFDPAMHTAFGFNRGLPHSFVHVTPSSKYTTRYNKKGDSAWDSRHAATVE